MSASSNESSVSVGVGSENVLISPKIKRYLGKAFRIGTVFGGHPFSWNQELQRPELGSVQQRQLWRMNMVIGLGYVAYVYVRYIQIELDANEASKYHKIYMQFIVSFYTLSAALHVEIIQNRGELTSYLNKYPDTIEEFTSRFVSNGTKTPLLITLIGYAMQIANKSIILVWILMLASAFARPHSHEQISSLFPNLHPQLMSTLATGSLCYVLYIFHSSAMVVIQSCFTISTLLVAISELSPRTALITNSFLREKNIVLNTYAWLFMVARSFNQIFTQLIIPFTKAILMTWCVYCTYGAVKMHGILSLAMCFTALFSFIFLVVIFTFLAEPQVRSSEVLKYWSTLQTRDPWFSKSVKSLGVITVKLRDAYFVDSAMILTMINIICNQTATFLLLNP